MTLLILFGVTLAAGLFFILLDVLRLPYLSTAGWNCQVWFSQALQGKGNKAQLIVIPLSSRSGGHKAKDQGRPPIIRSVNPPVIVVSDVTDNDGSYVSAK